MTPKTTLRSYVSSLTKSPWFARGGRAAPLPFGVNVSGYFASEKGLGEAVRADVRALAAAGVPHAIDPFVDRHGSHNVEAGYGPRRTTSAYRFNLVHINPDQVHVFAGQRDADYFAGHYNIGFWVWELSAFPLRWRPCFAYFDEIWVPSTFAQDSIARVSPLPVVRFPHAVAAPAPAPAPWPRARLEVPEGAFVFLFLFDFYSVVERKNPFGLIEAFTRAFAAEENVWLLLKVSHTEHDPDAWAELKRRCQGARVRLLDRVLERAEVDSLMASADAYVSLHRSEGFGITLAEAMALGKPVIATAYGGNADFTNGSNCHPVRYQLRELERDHGPYERGTHWAEPDLDHAAACMRAVVDRRAEAARLAQQGKRDVERWLSPLSVGRAMAQRLKLVASGDVGSRSR